jgi:hypothetical protein
MALRINDDCMTLELDGTKARAAVRVGSLWRVDGWPRLLNRNEAITALTLAEWLLSGHSADSPCAVAWRRELTGA